MRLGNRIGNSSAAGWKLGAPDASRKVAGMGDIVYWKDGREVYDSINLIYHYPNGVKMTYESMIANKFYGLEEEIMGSKGTMDRKKVNIILKMSNLLLVSCS